MLDIIEDVLRKLLEISVRKKDALVKILNISENQETLLHNITTENTLFHEMDAEKQKLIALVMQYDEDFQLIFENAKEVFESGAKRHGESVKTLQELIWELTDLDGRIRNQEQKNRSLIVNQLHALKQSISSTQQSTGQAAMAKSAPKTSPKDLLNNYHKQSKHKL